MPMLQPRCSRKQPSSWTWGAWSLEHQALNWHCLPSRRHRMGYQCANRTPVPCTRRGRRQTVARRKHPAVSNYYPIRGVPACVLGVLLRPCWQSETFLAYSTRPIWLDQQTKPGTKKQKRQCTQRRGLHPVYSITTYCHHYDQNGDVLGISWLQWL